MHTPQVDRYKQLLLKQRDIMIALTARLNERDEQIMALQVGTVPGTPLPLCRASALSIELVFPSKF